MTTWWVCAGCGTPIRMERIGLPQAPCECGECRYVQTSKEQALSNNPAPCDNYVSEERLAELSEKA